MSDTLSEICYDIRYPALHGRKHSGLPWSMRHMAAYQQYNHETKGSRLILIGPSKGVIDRLRQVVQLPTALESIPALPHVIMLEAAEAGWEPYIKYLSRKCEEMVSAN
jgi:hypothetical protein